MAKKSEKPELKTPGLTDESGNDGSSKSLDTSPVFLGSAPTPKEAEDAAKPKDKPKNEVAQPKKPSVPLRVYATVSGIKPDQIQAFAMYARREEMRPCPVLEWKDRYETFLLKPIRG